MEVPYYSVFLFRLLVPLFTFLISEVLMDVHLNTTGSHSIYTAHIFLLEK